MWQGWLDEVPSRVMAMSLVRCVEPEVTESANPQVTLFLGLLIRSDPQFLFAKRKERKKKKQM